MSSNAHSQTQSPSYAPSQRVGILGGGQLARMLALSAYPLGMQLHVLSSSAQDPATQVVSWHQCADPSHPKALQRFCEHIDILTFENENIPPSVWDLLQELASQGLTIHPHPEVARQLSDKHRQKILWETYRIPTAPFYQISPQQPLSHLPWDQMAKHIQAPPPYMFKINRGGYDGRGTLEADPATTSSPAMEEKWQHFVDMAEAYQGEVIAEQKISFTRELALLAVRSADTTLRFLPCVHTSQHRYQCDWVMGPVIFPPDSPQHMHLKELQEKISAFLHDVSYVGAIAFEIFDDGSQFLVNEAAPRVHNSAHYSLNALTHDQFELHIRAITGMHLPPVELVRPGFAMANLIASETHPVVLPKHLHQAFLHWYGKKENRSLRKMGHINALAKTPQDALDLALNARQHVIL